MKACARCNITVPSRTTLTIVTVTRYGHWWSIIVAVTSTLSRRHQCLSLPPRPHPLIFSVHSLRAKVATLTRLPNEPSFPPPPKPFESATFAKHRGGTSAKSVWSNHGGTRQQCFKSTGIDRPDVEAAAANACHHCSFLHIHWALHAFKANVTTKQDPASALVLCALPKHSPFSGLTSTESSMARRVT